uniref:Integron gene cassette protein n=1 Tax=Macrostomum lignano TaxID=282301 RepID=A0A1I8F5W8_9PLAT
SALLPGAAVHSGHSGLGATATVSFLPVLWRAPARFERPTYKMAPGVMRRMGRRLCVLSHRPTKLRTEIPPLAAATDTILMTTRSAGAISLAGMKQKNVNH